MIDPFKTFSDKIINKPNEHNKSLQNNFHETHFTDIVKEQYYFDISKVKVGDILLLDNKDKNLCNGILGEFKCIVTNIDKEKNSITVAYVKEGCDCEGKNYIDFEIDASYISDKTNYDEHIKLMNPYFKDYMFSKECFDKEKLKVGDYVSLIFNGTFLDSEYTGVVCADAFISNIFQDTLSVLFVFTENDESSRLLTLNFSVENFKNCQVVLKGDI